jgi:hypothetical protein
MICIVDILFSWVKIKTDLIFFFLHNIFAKNEHSMINKKEWKSVFAHHNSDIVGKFYIILQDAQMPTELVQEELDYKLYVPNDFVADAQHLLEQYSATDDYE